MADPAGGVIDILREPCQCCGLPMPLADLMFCRYGPGLKCADRASCGGRIERRIVRLKATSAKFRTLCAWPCVGPHRAGRG